jgi:hypothetical protein
VSPLVPLPFSLPRCKGPQPATPVPRPRRTAIYITTRITSSPAPSRANTFQKSLGATTAPHCGCPASCGTLTQSTTVPIAPQNVNIIDKYSSVNSRSAPESHECFGISPRTTALCGRDFRIGSDLREETNSPRAPGKRYGGTNACPHTRLTLSAGPWTSARYRPATNQHRHMSRGRTAQDIDLQIKAPVPAI